MGAGPSNMSSSLDWYPGEPTAHFFSDDCTCPAMLASAANGGSGACARLVPEATTSTRAIIHKKEERTIASLPVVELTDMQFIANGAFCDVFACKYRGWPVVAKRVRQDLPLPERQAALDNMWTEYDCLRQLRHPNVIDVYGMCRVRCREDYCDWNEKDVCLLLEKLALGTVGHLFGTTRNLDKSLATATMRSRKMKIVPFRCRLDRTLELALALEYVHGGSGVGTMMHRDIKSANVGFALNGNLKLMDFGLSKIVSPLGATESDTYKMTGEVGSYRYMAPELVKHRPYNAKADIYSWAILSWEILAVDRPYGSVNESTFLTKVVMGGERPKLNKSWPEQLRKLLTSAWHANFSERPTAAEVVVILRTIQAELSSKGERRPLMTAPWMGRRRPVRGSSKGRRGGGGSGGSSGDGDRFDSRTQFALSAPSSLNYSRPSNPLPADGVSGKIDGEIGGGGSGVSDGGEDVSPGGAVATTPVRKRFSFTLPRSSPSADRKWSFVSTINRSYRASTARARAALDSSSSSSSSGSGGGGQDGAVSELAPREQPPAKSIGTKAGARRSSSSCLTAESSLIGNDDGGGGDNDNDDDADDADKGALFSSTGAIHGVCRLHEGRIDNRETIVAALAREAEEMRAGKKKPLLPRPITAVRARREEAGGHGHRQEEGSVDKQEDEVRKREEEKEEGGRGVVASRSHAGSGGTGRVEPDGTSKKKKSSETTAEDAPFPLRRAGSSGLGKLWPDVSTRSKSATTAAVATAAPVTTTRPSPPSEDKEVGISAECCAWKYAGDRAEESTAALALPFDDSQSLRAPTHAVIGGGGGGGPGLNSELAVS